MRFSRDLAREILLNIEENWGANGPSQSQRENLGMLAPGTPMDSIHYHLRKLNEAGFVVLVLTSIRSKSGEPDTLHRYPASLTYAGHQFLDDIRDPGRWQEDQEDHRSRGVHDHEGSDARDREEDHRALTIQAGRSEPRRSHPGPKGAPAWRIGSPIGNPGCFPLPA